MIRQTHKQLLFKRFSFFGAAALVAAAPREAELKSQIQS
jgi:hypothetical protein